MTKLNVEIFGTTPLICNRFSEEAAMSATKGSRSSLAVSDKGSPVEICEKKLYLDEDGAYIIPQPNLMACIVNGGIFFKSGKRQITTQKTSLLYGLMVIEGSQIPIESDSGWKVDTRPVRIPSTGGRILAHRPCFDDWKLRFVIEVDDEMPLDLLRDIVDAAGKKIGLGDFRPQTKGPYGRFVVTEWKQVE